LKDNGITIYYAWEARGGRNLNRLKLGKVWSPL